MKLESFKDRKVTRRKMILISLGIITIVGVSLLLYKTFAKFSSEVSFPMMSGKVNYYGDSDVLFGFYNGEEKLTEMPQKGNPDNLVFEKAECDNGASVEWNEEKWAPLVKNLTTTKTRCTLYFAERKEIRLDKDIPLAQNNEDGLYAVEHNNLSELDSSWNKTEYRYAGVEPDNYVEFNNEKWRIIGLVNVKTESGVEQRIKIIRTNGVENQTDFGEYAWDRDDNETNNWTTSKLKDMLNGIYYNSGSGECYTGRYESTASQSACNFSGSGNLPKGLDEEAREMIDNEVIWNIGGYSSNHFDINAEMFYEKERGTSTGNDNTYPAEWTKENDLSYHKGIGLMYASDFGYAVGGEGRKSCLENELGYVTGCDENNWLNKDIYVPKKYQWLLLPYSSMSSFAYNFSNYGRGMSRTSSVYIVQPVAYLLPSVTIYDGDGSFDNPFKLRVG